MPLESADARQDTTGGGLRSLRPSAISPVATYVNCDDLQHILDNPLKVRKLEGAGIT